MIFSPTELLGSCAWPGRREGRRRRRKARWEGWEGQEDQDKKAKKEEAHLHQPGEAGKGQAVRHGPEAAAEVSPMTES